MTSNMPIKSVIVPRTRSGTHITAHMFFHPPTDRPSTDIEFGDFGYIKPLEVILLTLISNN